MFPNLLSQVLSFLPSTIFYHAHFFLFEICPVGVIVSLFLSGPLFDIPDTFAFLLQYIFLWTTRISFLKHRSHHISLLRIFSNSLLWKLSKSNRPLSPCFLIMAEGTDQEVGIPFHSLAVSQEWWLRKVSRHILYFCLNISTFMYLGIHYKEEKVGWAIGWWCHARTWCSGSGYSRPLLLLILVVLLPAANLFWS